MRRIPVRDFRSNIAEHLETDEALLVTRHGEDVAIVYTLRHPSALPREVRESIVDSVGRQLDVRPVFQASPVIERYKLGVDRTLIRENLGKTPEERLRGLQELQKFAKELRRR